MWSRACALLEEAERRHRQFFDLLSAPAHPPVWEPPVDIFMMERELHIVVAMPAVRGTSATVELTPSGLLIRGESGLPIQGGLARIVRMEIPYGRMERRIELPAGRYQLLRHEFQDGCLHIYLRGEPL
jgi:HSP20 family molecular chaperone IbpA